MRKTVHRTPADIELHDAAKAGDLEAAQKAVARGAQVDSQEEEHYITPLLWACSFGHFDVAAYLVDAGADVNYVDDNLDTPLHDAISGGHSDIVRLLLERGADPHALDGSGHTAMEAAVAYETASDASREAIIDALLGSGYDVNARNAALHNQTPLMAAVETAADTGNTRMVRYLLSKGADREAVDDDGFTAAEYLTDSEYADEVLEALQRNDVR